MIVTICHILYLKVLEEKQNKKNLQDFDFLQFVNMKMAFTSGIGFAELCRLFFSTLLLNLPDHNAGVEP